MESSHLVIFSTPGKFITKFNVLRCISLVKHYFGQGPGVEYQSFYEKRAKSLEKFFPQLWKSDFDDFFQIAGNKCM